MTIPVIKRLLTVQVDGYGKFNLYQDSANTSSFYVKQTEINALVGYANGFVAYYVNFAFIKKLHDDSGRLMNFVPLHQCGDYVNDLHTVGKRRAKATFLKEFFNDFLHCLQSIDGIEKVKNSYKTVDLRTVSEDNTDDIDLFKKTIADQREMLNKMSKQLDLLKCAFFEAQDSIQRILSSQEV